MKKIVLKIISLVLAVAMLVTFLTAASCFGSDKSRTDVAYFYRNYCDSSDGKSIILNGIKDDGTVLSNKNLAASVVGVTQVFYVRTYYGTIMEGYKCYCDLMVMVELTDKKGNKVSDWLYTDTISLGKVKKDSSGRLILPCATLDKVIEGKMYKDPVMGLSKDGKEIVVNSKGKKSKTTCQFYYDTKKKPHLDFFYNNTGEQILGVAVSAAVAAGLVAAAFYAMDYYAMEESIAHEFQLGMNSLAVSAAVAFGNNNVSKDKARSSDKLFDQKNASYGGTNIRLGAKWICGTENRNWYKYENESVN